MALSSKMRRVGESVYYKEILKHQLNEIVGENSHKLEHIVGRRKLVTHTHRVSEELLATVKAAAEAAMPKGTALVQYNHHIEVSWRDINKYAECKTVEDIKAVNPDYKTDLTSDGTWVYPLTACNSASLAFSWAKVAYFDGELPNLTNGQSMFNWVRSLKVWTVGLPNLMNGWGMFEQTSLKVWTVELPNLTDGTRMYYGVPLTVWTVELPNLTKGENMFTWCLLDKISALIVFDSIPTYSSGSHPLLIGIHVDHQNDEEVLAAIANAEAKGWTLTVQWNGTPSSTASTMAMGSLIYAKVNEMERPDGTSERVLDWGHYVTNPEGYETFRSLESAYSYFGLEMPNIN